MKKEFCTYTQALRLKELGFNEPCFGMYCEGRFHLLYPNSYKDIPEDFYREVDAPTYSQSFKWFREKYNLVFNFISYNIVKPREYHWSITWNDEAKATGIVKTYEEAELACLKKLIEIVESEKE